MSLFRIFREKSLNTVQNLVLFGFQVTGLVCRKRRGATLLRGAFESILKPDTICTDSRHPLSVRACEFVVSSARHLRAFVGCSFMLFEKGRKQNDTNTRPTRAFRMIGAWMSHAQDPAYRA